MNYLKKAGISLLYIIGIMLIMTLFITLLNYFSIIGGKALTTFKIITCILSLFVGGFIIGKKSDKKGWIEGIKLSLIFLVLLILFNYLGLGKTPQLKNLIYYSIIITSCVFGSMIGINFKQANNQ